MCLGCMKRKNVALEVGIIEKRETVAEQLKQTCTNFKKKSYWKMKFEQLLEISRSEHTILGILWPVDNELVYFTRAQRLVCYYCGAWVWREYGIYSLTKKTADRSIAALHIENLSLFITYCLLFSLRNTACSGHSGSFLSYRTKNWREWLYRCDFNASHVAHRCINSLDVCGTCVWLFRVHTCEKREGVSIEVDYCFTPIIQLSAVSTNVRQHVGA